jgi:two-component system, NarL family, response regulator DesR
VVARIVCVDDNPLVIDALARRIDLERDLQWLGALDERDDILGRLADLIPDVVLLDIDIPGIDGFEIVRRIRRELPTVRVVMFTGQARSGYFEQALESGAWGFLLKSASTQVILGALRRVALGEVVIHDGDDEAS